MSNVFVFTGLLRMVGNLTPSPLAGDARYCHLRPEASPDLPLGLLVLRTGADVALLWYDFDSSRQGFSVAFGLPKSPCEGGNVPVIKSSQHCGRAWTCVDAFRTEALMGGHWESCGVKLWTLSEMYTLNLFNRNYSKVGASVERYHANMIYEQRRIVN